MTSVFSVIIINYNYSNYLGKAIDSALEQTLDNASVEVIVVDDCSTDDSAFIIRRYGDQIKSHFHDKNLGMSASANSGFALTTGSRVLFLDADDYLFPGALNTFSRSFQDDVVLVHARLELVDENGTAYDVFPPIEIPLACGNVAPELARRGRFQTTVTSGLAFKRSALEKVMPIPEFEFDRSADGYLATVVPLYGQVSSIDTPLGAYRRHPSNHSGFSADIARRARWRIDHDENRYKALRYHGKKAAVPIGNSLGTNDPTHLEERLASLTFEPQSHPYSSDRRFKLGLQGINSTLASQTNLKRKVIHSIIFAAVGISPKPIAQKILAWKMERSTRPRLIDDLSRWLRKRLA